MKLVKTIIASIITLAAFTPLPAFECPNTNGELCLISATSNYDADGNIVSYTCNYGPCGGGGGGGKPGILQKY